MGRFERGGGRAEDHGRAGGRGAEPGGLAGVVARRLVLFIGGVVLLVEDHEPEVVDGGEHRRAGPEHDPRLAPADPPEGGAALGGAESAVEDGDAGGGGGWGGRAGGGWGGSGWAGAEAGAEERFLLGGERDLGDEQEGAAAGLEAGGDRLEVNLGLAAAVTPSSRKAPKVRAARAFRRAPAASCWGAVSGGGVVGPVVGGVGSLTSGERRSAAMARKPSRSRRAKLRRGERSSSRRIRTSGTGRAETAEPAETASSVRMRRSSWLRRGRCLVGWSSGSPRRAEPSAVIPAVWRIRPGGWEAGSMARRTRPSGQTVASARRRARARRSSGRGGSGSSKRERMGLRVSLLVAPGLVFWGSAGPSTTPVSSPGPKGTRTRVPGGSVVSPGCSREAGAS